MATKKNNYTLESYVLPFFNDENISNFKKILLGNIYRYVKEIKNKNMLEITLKEQIKSFTHKFFRKTLDMKPVLQIHIIKT